MEDTNNKKTVTRSSKKLINEIMEKEEQLLVKLGKVKDLNT